MTGSTTSAMTSTMVASAAPAINYLMTMGNRFSTFLKLKNDNYGWQKNMETLLCGLNQLSIMDRTLTQPTSASAAAGVSTPAGVSTLAGALTTAGTLTMAGRSTMAGTLTAAAATPEELTWDLRAACAYMEIALHIKDNWKQPISSTTNPHNAWTAPEITYAVALDGVHAVLFTQLTMM